MSDIFLSYASVDRERVRPLVEELESHGWDVWWDREIPLGKSWPDVIAEALEGARAMVVVWTEASVASKWVKIEAHEGEQLQAFVPVRLDPVVPPLQFRLTQAADLTGWTGDRGDEQFLAVIGVLEKALGAQPATVEELPSDPPPEAPSTSSPPPALADPTPAPLPGGPESETSRTTPSPHGMSSAAPNCGSTPTLRSQGGGGETNRARPSPPSPAKAKFPRGILAAVITAAVLIGGWQALGGADSAPGSSEARAARQEPPPPIEEVPADPGEGERSGPAVPPSVSLSATRSQVSWGFTTTLTWRASDATRATLWPGGVSVSPSGNRQVSPMETTVYRIEAASPAGNAVDSIRIAVEGPGVLDPGRVATFGPGGVLMEDGSIQRLQVGRVVSALAPGLLDPRVERISPAIAPYVRDPFDPANFYLVATHRVWVISESDPSFLEARSPDLTRSDPSRMEHAYIAAMASADPAVIWTGSGDGLVHVTRDGGRTWTNVTPPGLQDFASTLEIHARDSMACFETRDDGPGGWVRWTRTDDHGQSWRENVSEAACKRSLAPVG